MHRLKLANQKLHDFSIYKKTGNHALYATVWTNSSFAARLIPLDPYTVTLYLFQYKN